MGSVAVLFFRVIGEAEGVVRNPNDLTEGKKVCEQYAVDHDVSLEGERPLGPQGYPHDLSGVDEGQQG